MRRKKQDLKPINQPDFTHWQALYMAFYSSRLYIDVVKRWRGFGIKYFLLLMMLVSIPWTIIYTDLFNRYLSDELIYPIEHMPRLIIQNGEVSLDKPMPYFVKNKEGNVAIEIDTINDLKGFPEQYPTLSILVTKDKFYFRPPVGRFLPTTPLPKTNDKISTHEFDKTDNEIFSGHEWIKTSGIKKLKIFQAFFIYPFILGIFLGLYSLYNIVLSSIGRIISIVVLKYKITFKQSFRLAWVASTAPLALITALQLLRVNVNGTGPYYMGLVACYFAFGVICVKRESQQMVLG